MKHRRRWLAAAAAGALLLAALGSLYWPIPKKRLDPGPVVSLRITDRDGGLLREVLSDEGGRCRWVGLADISPFLLQATVSSEDKSFFSHPGIDVAAVARAFFQNLRGRRIVSGASTITQQVIRNIWRFRRTVPAKIREAWLAVRLDHTLSKEGILLQYLNRISYGNQAFGIEAASRLYFDKPSSGLSLAESAFLAAVPRAPTVLNPYRAFAGVKRRQEEILRRMHGLGYVDAAALERALREPIGLRPAAERFRAPHFCDWILSRVPTDERPRIAEIRTTLDAGLQAKVEALIRNSLARLERKGVTNAAAVVMDNVSGDVLAMAGSRDFFDAGHDGQVNGALAPRQPGSTLKPITYGLGLERGLTAATILEDDPTPFATPGGAFTPENYDESFHGAIRLRSALASSYNVPAVAVLQALGPDLLYAKLRELGFAGLKQPPGFYGVGLTLGNAEATLLELVRAYAALAREGVYRGERSILRTTGKDGKIREGEPPVPPRRVFTSVSAYIITSILSDRDARIPSFGYLSPLNLPFAAAAKTGTSKDFRDNWTIGYTPSVTVGVWAGDFSGKPMQSVSGVTGAGPLFRDILQLAAAERPAGSFVEPAGIVRAEICPLSGLRPGPRCAGIIREVFAAGTEPDKTCPLTHAQAASGAGRGPAGVGTHVPASGLAVLSPADGDVFKLDPVLRGEFQSIRLRAVLAEGFRTGVVEWWVNGEKIGESGPPYGLAWRLKPGSYTIKARARSDSGPAESPPVRITVLS
ncbi:MAG: penicillin-binding protein 1C [Acidobacteriota bacterium]|nr:penicillin-binding protein 1C [Acidobacteriota bacterium]